MQAKSARANGQLSYKFQRLREQLRNSVLTGEFSGRLPGERELGRRFNANAKTINKALCDLSSEGLVERHIGRGTFVVPQNGQASLLDARRRFCCVLPAKANGAGPSRQLIDHLRSAVQSHGHMLEELDFHGTRGSGQTMLSTWSVDDRRHADGLFSIPMDPLSGRDGQLDDASIAEVLRRHLPLVVVGAYTASAKLPTVVPDFADAGFRLAEHLVRVGCRTIIVLTGGPGCRESQLVYNGVQAANARHETTCECISIEQVDENVEWVVAVRGRAARAGHARSPIGLICLGANALQAVMDKGLLDDMTAFGELACMLEPGDDSARKAGAAYYDVCVPHIAQWAVRLMVENKPGQRPIEIIVPGVVRCPQRLNGRLNVPEIGKSAHSLKDQQPALAAMSI